MKLNDTENENKHWGQTRPDEQTHNYRRPVYKAFILYELDRTILVICMFKRRKKNHVSNGKKCSTQINRQIRSTAMQLVTAHITQNALENSFFSMEAFHRHSLRSLFLRGFYMSDVILPMVFNQLLIFMLASYEEFGDLRVSSSWLCIYYHYPVYFFECYIIIIA